MSQIDLRSKMAITGFWKTAIQYKTIKRGSFRNQPETNVSKLLPISGKPGNQSNLKFKMAYMQKGRHSETKNQLNR